MAQGECDGCKADLRDEWGPSYTTELDGRQWCHGITPEQIKTSGCYGKEMRLRAARNRELQIAADRYHTFWNQQSRWSQETFGSDQERGPRGPILHLVKEVKEVLDALNEVSGHAYDSGYKFPVQMELVDCFFLVTDAARRSGLTYEG